MDSCQLTNTVRQDEIMSEHFLGVFPRDMIPKHTGNGSLIANTDTSDKPGTHWVAMYKENHECEFFDSYGRAPFENNFLEIRTRHNKVKLQSDYSQVCGHYCLYFLYFRSRGNNLNEIINSLKYNGDFIVEEFVAKNFNKCMKGSGMSCKTLL